MRKALWLTLLWALALSARCENILMVGDSHVAGKIYPHTVDSLLRKHHSDFQFSHFGINGAAFSTFCKKENMDTILARKPDLMIVHLGTNDSYGARFNTELFRSRLTEFFDTVHTHLPDTKMVFVSPFFNKRKSYTSRRRKKRRRFTWVLNQHTRTCADLLSEFCAEHPEAWIVDNNASHGMDFINEGLIRNDFVHLSACGYEVLGRQVVDELITIPQLFPADSVEVDLPDMK